MCRFVISIATVLTLALPALGAEEILDGPIPADVVSVYDGDTFTVRARIWPGVRVETKVRVYGYDTPEIRGECEKEKKAALAARDFLRARIGESVTLFKVKKDKFGDRVDARVELSDGRDLAELMLESGHARKYDGGKRGGWCGG